MCALYFSAGTCLNDEITFFEIAEEKKYQLQNNAIACTVTDIDENVGPDKKVTIIRTFDDIAVFSADMDRDSLVYGVSSVPEGEYYFAGIGKYYFGARYYDPELALWTSRDAAAQFWNAYGYGNNPVLMVDEDGNFIWLIPAAIGFGIGYVRAGLRTHEWGLSSVKAGLWTGAGVTLAFSPAALYIAGGMMVTQGTMTAISNQAVGWGSITEQFSLGAMEGLMDFGNMASMGIANGLISQGSGYFRGIAYNSAHGITGEIAKINISEAQKMNKLFGDYPGQGSLIKYGSDLAWRSFKGGGNDRYMYARAKRLYKEDPAAYRSFIKKYEDYPSGEYYHGQKLPQLGHALFGTIVSHEPWYEGFETYGESWVKWETQDEWDDRGIFYYLYRLYDEKKNGNWGEYE